MAILNDKVALITGASRGIGRATSVALAKAGAKVYLAAEGTEEELSQLARECRLIGPSEDCAAYGRFDLSSADDVEAMVDAAIRRYSTVDILVNNAGIRIRHPFGDFSSADFDTLIAVNLRAPFLASQAVLRHMRVNGGGRIINVASQMGIVTTPGSTLYGLSKAALIHMTKSMAVELAADGIMVNAVSPGPIETEFTQSQMQLHKGYKEDRAARIPLGRWGKPEEVAETILFLASTAATFIHGSNVLIDGGYVLR